MIERIEGLFIADGSNHAEVAAEMFCEMSGAGQAEFFDRVAKISDKWNGRVFQWAWMQPHLTPEARAVIDELYNYANDEPTP